MTVTGHASCQTEWLLRRLATSGVDSGPSVAFIFQCNALTNPYHKFLSFLRLSVGALIASATTASAQGDPFDIAVMAANPVGYCGNLMKPATAHTGTLAAVDSAHTFNGVYGKGLSPTVFQDRDLRRALRG